MKLHSVTIYAKVTHAINGYKSIKNHPYQKLNNAYAMKYPPSRGAIRRVGRQGIGTDVTSKFELQAALENECEAHNLTDCLKGPNI